MRRKFKIGDRVVCVRDHFVDTLTGKKYKKDPRKGDILNVKRVFLINKTQYLEFEEIPRERNEPEIYISIAFRLVERKFTNHETAKLVEEFKEQENMHKQLQEDELKIFTTGADF